MEKNMNVNCNKDKHNNGVFQQWKLSKVEQQKKEFWKIN